MKEIFDYPSRKKGLQTPHIKKKNNTINGIFVLSLFKFTPSRNFRHNSIGNFNFIS